jgi:hypothetical protein
MEKINIKKIVLVVLCLSGNLGAALCHFGQQSEEELREVYEGICWAPRKVCKALGDRRVSCCCSVAVGFAPIVQRICFPDCCDQEIFAQFCYPWFGPMWIVA